MSKSVFFVLFCFLIFCSQLLCSWQYSPWIHKHDRFGMFIQGWLINTWEMCSVHGMASITTYIGAQTSFDGYCLMFETNLWLSGGQHFDFFTYILFGAHTWFDGCCLAYKTNIWLYLMVKSYVLLASISSGTEFEVKCTSKREEYRL